MQVSSGEPGRMRPPPEMALEATGFADQRHRVRRFASQGDRARSFWLDPDGRAVVGLELGGGRVGDVRPMGRIEPGAAITEEAVVAADVTVAVERSTTKDEDLAGALEGRAIGDVGGDPSRAVVDGKSVTGRRTLASR